MADVRLVQVIIPAGKRSAVLDVLDEAGVEYVLTDETSGREYTDVVYFPLPTAAVEPVLDSLGEIGVDEDAYTVVLDARTVVSRKFSELQEQYDEADTEDRVAREEIRAEAADLVPDLDTYLILAVVSAVVATAGLLLDSPAVVVGSMVIAPVLGPAIATSVGTVLQDDDLFRRGVRLQVLGFGVVVLAATLFALAVKFLFLVPPGLEVTEIEEVGGRVSPDFLSLAVALGAGVAGALSLSSGVSAALVGVMIAAALIPPAAAVGIGIAWGLPNVVLGAGVLVLVNALSVNLAALGTFWYRNYRPESWFKFPEAREATARRAGMLLFGLAVLSVFLVGITYTSFQTATSEQEIRGEVQTVLENPEYAEVSLIQVEITRDERLLTSTPERVTVTVGRPSDRSYPEFAARIDERVDRRTGSDVEVQVQFVEISTA